MLEHPIPRVRILRFVDFCTYSGNVCDKSYINESSHRLHGWLAGIFAATIRTIGLARGMVGHALCIHA